MNRVLSFSYYNRRKTMKKTEWNGKGFSFVTNKNCTHFQGMAEDSNCLFYYLPFYAFADKWVRKFHYTKTGVKDCIAATIFHAKENYGAIGDQYNAIADRMQTRRINQNG